MPQFTRRTILAAVDFILVKTHAEIDRFALEYGLEGVVVGYSKADKINALGRYLLRNPEATTDTGENLTDAITLALVGQAVQASFRGHPREFSGYGLADGLRNRKHAPLFKEFRQSDVQDFLAKIGHYRLERIICDRTIHVILTNAERVFLLPVVGGSSDEPECPSKGRALALPAAFCDVC